MKAVKKGAPDWEEVLIFRVSEFDDGKPDFAGTIKL